MSGEKAYGEIKGPYKQRAIIARIEALFLDNLGKIVTRDQILEVAKDPVSGRIPENWHQRLSELRTNRGYTILTSRDLKDLKVSEYLLLSAEKQATAGRRVKPSRVTWRAVLTRAGHTCEWHEAGQVCGLREGERDPVGGGTVRLTADHKTPHSMDSNTDPANPIAWQALCGRHQVVKKNYWDNLTGKLNVRAIVQAASDREKRLVFEFLIDYFAATGTLKLLPLLQSATEEEKRDLYEFLKVYFSSG